MNNHTRPLSLVLLTLLAFAGAVAPAWGQTVIFVDASATGSGNGSNWANAYTSVQPALNAATSGKQVWVASGRYVGTITLKLGVALYGGFAGTEDPATFDLADRDVVANETILDGNQMGSVVTAPSGATAATRIDGFTITNGIGTLSQSYRYGGGIYCSGSAPTIAHNTITGNSAYSGGGLCLRDSSSPTIANNTVSDNSAGNDGGGLCLRDSSSPTIANNTITDNSASSSGGGLGVMSSAPSLTNNTITGNNAGSDGGGMHLTSSSPTIANTIVAFNSSGVYRNGNGTPTARHNCVYGNTAYNYSGLTDPTGTAGNVSVDPLLADLAYRNEHLQAGSPCVNTGTNGYAVGSFDIDGQPRIQPPGAGTVDIGADEANGTVWGPGPYVVVRVSPEGDDAHDGSSWPLAKQTVQAAIDAASALGGEVWVQAGTYAECITLHPYAYVYGGFAGRETARDERNWHINVTILDGQQQGSVVSVRAGNRVSTLDGFTIRNGTGTFFDLSRYGGGLYLYRSFPTIANNTITGNSASGDRGAGGGLYVSACSPTITNNAITGNSASANGGGVSLSSSSPTIANNTITGNTVTGTSGTGGGLDLASSSPAITNNTVTGNSATSSGGGLSLSSSSPTIVNNAISGNIVTGPSGTGGGLYLAHSSPMIANNAVSDNTVTGTSGIGGGLYLFNSSSPTITHNSITGNTVTGTSGAGGGLGLHNYCLPAITNNTITCNAVIGSSGTGGGLYLSLSSPSIASNTIAGNSATSGGGGLRLYYSAPTIMNNTITGNTVTSVSGVGGGLYLTALSSTITSNIIAGNSASGGGGLYVYYNSTPTIASNTIRDNSATSHGGGLYVRDSTPTIASNMITGNSATNRGGGLYLSNSSPALANNTINNNGASDGGGLYLYNSSPALANSIIAFNSSGVCRYSTSSKPALRHNCVYRNIAYNYSGLADPTGTDGNVSVDPLLADPAYGNGHLQPGSPCADSGTNGYAVGDFDIDGQMRIQSEDGTVDIGADESDGTIWNPGPYVIVRVSPDGDDAQNGSSWTLAKRTVRAGIGTAAALGGDVWVHAGTYAECVTLHSYAHVYGGFAGGETERDERDWESNVTILDGQQQGSVVTVLAGEQTSALDGFWITHGRAAYGGGLYLCNSSPRIANNTIIGNSASSGGGGLYASSSSATIANNTFTDNNATDDGGGLCLRDLSSPTIANNTIMGNSASFGGGVSLSNASPTIANNTIKGNSTSIYGGGLYLAYFSSPPIANNTITGNSASYDGGGLYVEDSCSPPIANNILAFNSSGIFRGNTSSAPTLHHNCVYGNTAYNYLGIIDPTGTDGNISANPRFVQNPGNLYLQADSPSIDAGDNASVPTDAPDLDGDGDSTESLPWDLTGHARIVDSDGDGTALVDMGAYEYRTDCNSNGAADADDLVHGTSSDCNTNGIPDECEPDCNSNEMADECDISGGTSLDADGDGTPDECEEPVPVILQSALPPNQGTLWRTAQNIVRLTFDGNLPAAPAAGQIVIQELLAGGGFGPDLSAGFTFTIDTDPKVLKIRETATSLTHRKWYAIRNTGGWTGVANFEVQYVVLMGDVDNNGFVQNLDAGAIYPNVSPLPKPDDYRYDVDGNGFCQNLDAGGVFPRVSPLPKPAKPSGH